MRTFLSALVMAAALGACMPVASSDEPARVVPAATADIRAQGAAAQTAVLAGGCFWGVEGVFEHVRGVTNVRSGYAGGGAADAHYEMVSGGRTGHAEAVEVTYDPRVISYGQILRIFFSVAHDPTLLNRQGPDHGAQYRSNIFTANAEQARVANAYIAQLNAAHVYDAPIVTRVDALARFFPAEDYHQDFMANNPNYPYIVINDRPKVQNLQRLFPALYRSSPNA